MVSALSGILLKCDPPAMEIVKQINETRHFIIEQLDENVALCKEVVFDFLQEEVTRRLEIAERCTLTEARPNDADNDA